MKKISYLLALSFFLLVCSCSKDNDDIQANVAETSQIIAIAKSGAWTITDFKEDGVDETANFNAYVFRFEDNNILTATSSSSTVSGTWRISDDTGDDDDPANDIDFNIFFNSPEVFTDLTEDWEVVSASSNQMVLIHFSGGNGGTDNLTFTKN